MKTAEEPNEIETVFLYANADQYCQSTESQ